MTLTEVASLDVDFNVATVGLHHRGTGLDLDAFRITLADNQVVPAPYVAHDRLVEGVAGDAHRAPLHHTTGLDHGDVRRAAADVHHHARGRRFDLKPSAERSRDRLFYEINASGPR